ncbi:MAG: patatin-like phospholipase family protein [Chloroflexota bacterium]
MAIKKRVGLALGGGAARGLAHVGVLEVLEGEGIPVDVIAGTSAGAIAGALFAQGKSSRQITKLAMELGGKKLAFLIDLSLPKSGFISGRKLQALLTGSISASVQFSDLKIPFACVAADIETGEEVVIDRGPVLAALRASISIPAIFAVVKRGGRFLVDGSLVNPVPVSAVRKLGAEFVIAVNVIPDATERSRNVKSGGKAASEPNIVHVMMQSMHIGTYSLVRSSMKGADIVIEPDVAHFGGGEFHRASEIIQQGRLAARSAIPEIKRKLGRA